MAWELLHFPFVLMKRLNKTESAVSLYCRFSLFLKDPFFQIIFGLTSPVAYLGTLTLTELLEIHIELWVTYGKI